MLPFADFPYILKNTHYVCDSILTIEVKTIADCYYVLFVLHSQWKSLPHKFTDNIANIPENGMQELRTTLFILDIGFLQIRIKTHTMSLFEKKGVSLFCFEKGFKTKNRNNFEQVNYALDKLSSSKQIPQLLNDFLGETISIYIDKKGSFFIPHNATILDGLCYAYKKDIDKAPEILLNGEKIFDYSLPLYHGDLLSVSLFKKSIDFSNINTKNTNTIYGKTLIENLNR